MLRGGLGIGAAANQGEDEHHCLEAAGGRVARVAAPRAQNMPRASITTCRS